MTLQKMLWSLQTINCKIIEFYSGTSYVIIKVFSKCKLSAAAFSEFSWNRSWSQNHNSHPVLTRLCFLVTVHSNIQWPILVKEHPYAPKYGGFSRSSIVSQNSFPGCSNKSPSSSCYQWSSDGGTWTPLPRDKKVAPLSFPHWNGIREN